MLQFYLTEVFFFMNLPNFASLY